MKDEAHFDSFTHADEQQKKNGQWYFHKMGKGYKGGSYKGLDITFSKVFHHPIPLYLVSNNLERAQWNFNQSFVRNFNSKVHRRYQFLPSVKSPIPIDNFCRYNFTPRSTFSHLNFLGPSLVVDHILSLTNAKDIESLTKQENFSWDLTQKSDLYLKHDEENTLEKRTLLTSGR